MTKADKKEIQKLIKHLPAMQSKSRTDKRYTLVGRNRYLVNGAPAIINHKTSAEKIFKKDGIEGVKQYCEQIREKYRLFYEQHENGAPGTN